MRDLLIQIQRQRKNKWFMYGIVGALISSFATPCFAGLFYDNRFFPLTLYPYVTYYDQHAYAKVGPFITTSSSAFEREEREMPLFEIFGKYDQKALALSMAQAGLGNPFVEAGQEDFLFIRSTIPWKMDGRIQSQGLFFGSQYQFSDHLLVGFEWYFMRVNSSIDFFLEESRERAEELDRIRRDMNEVLGINGGHVDEAGMGDLDLYFRVGNDWDYTMKFRHIALGMRFGALVPAGKRRNPCNPASVPFGGNGHFGFYIMGDGEFELKEDWKAGFYIGLSKRIPKTQLQRMPVGKEPSIFGAVLGEVSVNPGVTFMFAPYFSVENLRQGFGARIQYTLAVHGDDEWGDRRSNPCPPVQLKRVVETSSWSGGHVTLTSFYDFGKMKVHHNADPVIFIAWDIPVNMFSTKDKVKTNKVQIGIEFNF